MNIDIHSSTGIALASLLALSWPATYLMSRIQSDQGESTAVTHWVESHRPAPSSDCPNASSLHPVNAFRMGINPDYPPFSGKIVP
ncbi:MAG: hypothetical protein HQL87_17160 [Magnetococcales bacterium]|nr:hypothetical protein [Magnetococcales bacterium]